MKTRKLLWLIFSFILIALIGMGTLSYGAAQLYHKCPEDQKIYYLTIISNSSNHYYYCSVCHKTLNSSAHLKTTLKSSFSGSCQKNSYKKYECGVCGKEFTVYGDKGPHTYGAWTTKKSATCTTSGTRTRTCTVCGNKETETIKATGHTWGSETKYYKTISSGKNGTCCQMSYKICKSCGTKSTETAVGSPKSHVWNSGAKKSDGSIVYTCKNCNTTYTEKSQTVSVQSVSLSLGSSNLKIGATTNAKPLIYPSNATNQAVTYTSSNTSVATVSSTGVVTAKSAGTATITVKTADGGKTASQTVSVTADNTLKSVTLIYPKTTLKKGEFANASLVFNPSGVTGYTVEFSSFFSSVVSVDRNRKNCRRKCRTK